MSASLEICVSKVSKFDNERWKSSIRGNDNVTTWDLHLCDFAAVAERSKERHSRFRGHVCNPLRHHRTEPGSGPDSLPHPGLDRWRYRNRTARWRKPASWRRWRVLAHKVEQRPTCNFAEAVGMGMKWPKLPAWRAQQWGQVESLLVPVVT